MTESAALKPPLTKVHVFQLFNILVQLRDKIEDPRIQYVVVKLRNQLNAEAVAVNEAMRPSADIEAYQKKRSAISLECAERDQNNKPKMQPSGSFAIADDKKSEYDEKMRVLMEESKDILAEQRDRSLKLQTLLSEPSDVVISETLRIPVSCLPKGISGAQVEVLFPILLDDATTSKT